MRCRVPSSPAASVATASRTNEEFLETMATAAPASERAQSGHCRHAGQLALQRCHQPLRIVLFEVELMRCRRGEDLEEHQLVQIILSSGLVQGFAAWLLECRDKSLLEDGLHLLQKSGPDGQLGQQVDLVHATAASACSYCGAGPSSTPPSMMNSEPVEKLASSEATNSTRRVTSSGSATRAIAKCFASAATAAAASGPAVIGVRIGPGWIELTRMLSRPSSSAAVRVNPRTPHLLAAYAAV